MSHVFLCLRMTFISSVIPINGAEKCHDQALTENVLNQTWVSLARTSPSLLRIAFQSPIIMNIDEFQVRGKEMIEYICEYLRTLEGKRVTANVDPGYLRPLLPKEAPAKGESWDAIIRDVDRKIMPGVSVNCVDSIIDPPFVDSDLFRC